MRFAERSQMMDLGRVYDKENHEGNPCSESITANVSLTASGATGSANATVFNCLDVIYHSDSSFIYHEYTTVEPNQSHTACVPVGQFGVHDGMNGYNVLVRSYVFDTTGNQDCIYEKETTWQSSVVTGIGYDCFGDPCSGWPLSAELVGVDFLSEHTAIDYNDRAPWSSTAQGLIASYSDGSAVRWGLLNDQDFTLTTTSNGYTVNGTHTIQISGPSGTEIGMIAVTRSDSFSTHDADIDADGQRTWRDRHAFADAFGSSFGENPYNPRADFDLDGSVDQDDLTAFNTAFCPADVDDGTGTGTPDGGVTIDDLTYYLYIFDEGGEDADVDDGSATGLADGGTTIEDLLFFVDRFDTGC